MKTNNANICPYNLKIHHQLLRNLEYVASTVNKTSRTQKAEFGTSILSAVSNNSCQSIICHRSPMCMLFIIQKYYHSLPVNWKNQ